MSEPNVRPALGPGELEYYADGAWYDAEYVHIRSDIPYYASVARRTNGPILELAAGTGRLTIPMALITEHRVVGLDLVPGMIDRAEQKRIALEASVRDRLQFRVADIRSFELKEKFAAIVLGFNTIMHLLADDDVRSCLDTTARHLEPGGLFYLDLMNPHGALSIGRDPSGRYDPQQMIDPATAQRYVVCENNAYDPRTQENVLTFYYRQADRDGQAVGPEWSRSVRLRVFYPRELEGFLHRSGFEIVEDYDDFARTRPFSGLGGRRVLVAKVRGHFVRNSATEVPITK